MVKERTAHLRDEMIKKFGLVIPGIRYRFIERSDSLYDNGFRIMVLNQTNKNDEAKIYETTPEKAIEDIMNVLKKRASDYRVFWLTAESTFRLLNTLPKNLKNWLMKQYSLTDLKLLFRTIINPTRAEFEQGNIPAGHTLRHFEWLIRSIPFWTQIDGKYNIKKLSKRLRNMQKVRIEAKHRSDDITKTPVTILSGIKLLNENKYKEAINNFSPAIQKNIKTAANDFLKAYSTNFQVQLQKRLSDLCRSPINSFLTRKERIELEVYVNALRGTPFDQAIRRMKLCLLINYPASYQQQKQKLTKEIIRSYSNPTEWPAKEAAWFTWKLFHNYNPVIDSSKQKSRVKNFFESSFKRQTRDQAYRQFNKLLSECYKHKYSNWCKKWLKELALKSNDYRIKLSLSFNLGESEKIDELKLALKLSNQSQKLINKAKMLKPEDKLFYLKYVEYNKASALVNLAELESSKNYKESETILQTLLDSKSFGYLAHHLLLTIKKNTEQYEDAKKLVAIALTKWPKEVNLYEQQILINLLQRNKPQVIKIVNGITDALGTNPNSLYLVALGQILTDTGNWQRMGRQFILTNHRYVDYITMMMYANLIGKDKLEAEELLQKRWRDIYKENWKQQLSRRLREGDDMAWREMFIGYYQDAVTADEIFIPLESDDLFNKSDLKYTSLSRKGMLTEAYFYDAMLAKANGNIKRMQKRLQQVININYTRYSEYSYAKYLLASIKQSGQ